MYASMTSPYRSSEKISVTLTLMPSASVAVIAGTPSAVAGILMNMFGRSTSHHSCLASATVAAVSLREPRVDLDRHPAVHAAGARRRLARSTSAAHRMS